MTTNKRASTASASDRADANIASLTGRVIKHCAALDSLSEDEWYEAHKEQPGLAPQARRIATDLDRLERKIIDTRANTIGAFVAKAIAANALGRFGYEGIPESIVRDLADMRELA